MVKAFVRIVAVIERLNKECKIFNEAGIGQLKRNVADFAAEKEVFLRNLKELTSFETDDSNRGTDQGVKSCNTELLTHALETFDGRLALYSLQIYAMQGFLQLWFWHYKTQASLTEGSVVKVDIPEPADFAYRATEFREYMALLERYNKYLQAPRALSEERIKSGYEAADRLADLTCAMHALLDLLEPVDAQDVKKIAPLLKWLQRATFLSCKTLTAYADVVVTGVFPFYHDCM